MSVETDPASHDLLEGFDEHLGFDLRDGALQFYGADAVLDRLRSGVDDRSVVVLLVHEVDRDRGGLTAGVEHGLVDVQSVYAAAAELGSGAGWMLRMRLRNRAMVRCPSILR